MVNYKRREYRMEIFKETLANSTLDISFSSTKWDYIKVIREFMKNYLQLNYLKNEDISKVIIASSEMLENALKYSIDTNIRIHLFKNLEKNQIELAVYNKASITDFQRANTLVDEMNKAEDPFLFYVGKMRDKTTKTEKGGGLGLARINHEAGANLQIEFNEIDSRIKVSAVLTF